jgi:hypothetical protein
LLPVPSKWSIAIGPPVSVSTDSSDNEATLETAESVRRRIDQMIAELLVQRRSILFGDPGETPTPAQGRPLVRWWRICL